MQLAPGEITWQTSHFTFLFIHFMQQLSGGEDADSVVEPFQQEGGFRSTY